MTNSPVPPTGTNTSVPPRPHANRDGFDDRFSNQYGDGYRVIYPIGFADLQPGP